MARPKMNPAERMTVTFSFTASEADAEQIRAMAQNAGLSLAEFARRAALNKRVKAVATTAPDFETRHELRRIGNNLNQIARALNQGGPHSRLQADTFTALTGKLDHLFDKWLAG